jgi:acyl-CoA reductase-like NAD-dependent aldehyde dehydrogenase
LEVYPLISGSGIVDTGSYFQVRTPFNGEVAGKVAIANRDLIEDSIQKASEALPILAEMPLYWREEILNFVANLLEEKKEFFAKLMTSETGKVLKESRGEVSRAVLTLRISAEEAKRIKGEIIPLDWAKSGENRQAIINRVPKGVVGAITPFNYPLNLVAHKFGPAIASGCPIILKPSSSAPITALELGKLFLKAGLPAGAISVLPSKPEKAEIIAKSDDVAHLTFTGSDVVGWYLKDICGKKSISLELGGNAPCIVCSDADIEYASRRITIGSFHNAGQSCISTQRVYVDENIFQDLLEKIVCLTEELVIGDPMDENTDIGPMITEASAIATEEILQRAVDDGAEVLTGGERNIAFISPAVVINTTPDMEINRTEIFAPVVTITKFSNFDNALALANDTRYGLQASIFTNDIAKINKAYKILEFGGVVVNDVPTYRVDHMPYGGIKDSGMGKEGPRYAIEEMTELKLMVINMKEYE